ncbi:thiamine pyrophosphate-dependent dehydrogenase E1 component subunit alpha [Labilithrix luteola]|uniref:thiamine pyrophosphate-dependent dehydrogenase E1 component subunit alpha n=1 Tax=Labilithrix luteola TaxID=1391654 RepID=UPI0014727B6E|nr:thiamine pyrophosphate-dependent enzyme [Labilithrix luteola]
MSCPPEAPAEPASGLLRALADDGALDGGEPAFRQAANMAVAAYRAMVRLRLLSARMVELQRSEKIAFHASSIGEEAVIVASALGVRADDWLFPGVREWGAAVVRGLPIAAYVHHAFGTALDPAKGHSPPDHPPARRFNVAPASGVVGAHAPQAVGAAWSAKVRKDRVATLAIFGDGATSTGDFHNAMNFAGVLKAPCVLVCRNNGHAVSTPQARQTKTETFAEKAVAYGVASARVDGSDVLAVLAVVRAAIARADEGKGPTLVEAVTTPASGAALEGADLLALGPNDPIVRLRRFLDREGALDAASAEAIVREARAEIDTAVAEAEAAEKPAKRTIFEDVYADVPAHLVEQQRTLAYAEGGRS